MPAADKLEWPQGQPLFEVMWRSIADSLDGHGIIDSGDMLVSATTTDLEIEVAAGKAWYVGTEYELAAAETHLLSAGDASADRWDMVYFDTSTESSGVREGTPAASPEPPDVQGDEILLAVVYVPAEATDVPDADVLNWRASFSNSADEVSYADSTGEFQATNVAAALDALEQAVQLTQYPVPLGDLNAPFALSELTDNRLEQRTEDPTTPEAGRVWMRTDSGILKWHDGTTTKATGRDH